MMSPLIFNPPGPPKAVLEQLHGDLDLAQLVVWEQNTEGVEVDRLYGAVNRWWLLMQPAPTSKPLDTDHQGDTSVISTRSSPR